MALTAYQTTYISGILMGQIDENTDVSLLSKLMLLHEYISDSKDIKEIDISKIDESLQDVLKAFHLPDQYLNKLEHQSTTPINVGETRAAVLDYINEELVKHHTKEQLFAKGWDYEKFAKTIQKFPDHNELFVSKGASTSETKDNSIINFINFIKRYKTSLIKNTKEFDIPTVHLQISKIESVQLLALIGFLINGNFISREQFKQIYDRDDKDLMALITQEYLKSLTTLQNTAFLKLTTILKKCDAQSLNYQNVMFQLSEFNTFIKIINDYNKLVLTNFINKGPFATTISVYDLNVVYQRIDNYIAHLRSINCPFTGSLSIILDNQNVFLKNNNTEPFNNLFRLHLLSIFIGKVDKAEVFQLLNQNTVNEFQNNFKKTLRTLYLNAAFQISHSDINNEIIIEKLSSNIDALNLFNDKEKSDIKKESKACIKLNDYLTLRLIGLYTLSFIFIIFAISIHDSTFGKFLTKKLLNRKEAYSHAFTVSIFSAYLITNLLLSYKQKEHIDPNRTKTEIFIDCLLPVKSIKQEIFTHNFEIFNKGALFLEYASKMLFLTTIFTSYSALSVFLFYPILKPLMVNYIGIEKSSTIFKSAMCLIFASSWVLTNMSFASNQDKNNNHKGLEKLGDAIFPKQLFTDMISKSRDNSSLIPAL